MDKYLSENKLYFCFVDFRKAYDSIWCEVLFKNFLGYRVSTNFVSLFKNMDEKTRGIIEFFPWKLGLNQGCNMSPILFNLFTDDINEIFDDCFYHPDTLSDLKLNLLYADDLIVIFETRTGLQSF